MPIRPMVTDPKLIQQLSERLKTCRVASSDYEKAMRRYAAAYKAHADAVAQLADLWSKETRDYRRMVEVLDEIIQTQEALLPHVQRLKIAIEPGLREVYELRDLVYRCAARATFERTTLEQYEEDVFDEIRVMAALVGLDPPELPR